MSPRAARAPAFIWTARPRSAGLDARPGARGFVRRVVAAASVHHHHLRARGAERMAAPTLICGVERRDYDRDHGRG